jgi:hypothetical protein
MGAAARDLAHAGSHDINSPSFRVIQPTLSATAIAKAKQNQKVQWRQIQAWSRPRGPGGRFLSNKEIEELSKRGLLCVFSPSPLTHFTSFSNYKYSYV